MDLCVLPQTGANEQWLVLAVVAFVVIGAGVALALSGKARRRVATGLGALAIVGALAIGGVHAAPAAQADAGAADCITPGAQPAADVVVTPAFPTVAQACYVEPTITPATTTGITYTSTREGDVTTVSATAQPGYQLLAGATSTWTYDMTPPTPLPSPVELPGGVLAYEDGSTDDGSATILTPADADFVPGLQSAADAGGFAYSFDASQAAYAVSIDTTDAEGNPNPQVSASAPIEGATLAYDLALGAYLFSVPLDFDYEALYEQLDAALEQAFIDQGVDPETSQLVAGREYFDRLAIAATWDGGPVCGEQLGFVGIDGIISEFPGDVPGSIRDSFPVLDSIGTADDAAAAEAPAAEAPAVEAPATEAPATEAPATEAPASEEPAVEEAEVLETPAPEVEVVEPVEG